MVRAFGAQVTEQYISGIYAQFGELGASLVAGRGWRGAARGRRHPGVGRGGQPRDRAEELHRRRLVARLRTRQLCRAEAPASTSSAPGSPATPAASPRSAGSFRRAVAALAANPTDPVGPGDRAGAQRAARRRQRPGRRPQLAALGRRSTACSPASRRAPRARARSRTTDPRWSAAPRASPPEPASSHPARPTSRPDSSPAPTSCRTPTARRRPMPHPSPPSR